MQTALFQPVGILFVATTAMVVLFLALTLRKSKPSIVLLVIGGSLVWLALQAYIGIEGVYSNHTAAIPPKIVLFGILPMLLLVVALFVSKKGRQLITTLPLKVITYLHMIRIPVEIGLYWLYLQQLVPKQMTFEGVNFDIFAGITAPLIAYFFVGNKTKIRLVLGWNFLCLLLLLNIVVVAFLSAPSPLQKIAFDQPNVAILHFPYVWLPTFIVPVVLCAHLVAIRHILTYHTKSA